MTVSIKLPYGDDGHVRIPYAALRVMTGTQLKVFCLVMALTCGGRRRTDRTTIKASCPLIGLKYKTVRDTLTSLATDGWLEKKGLAVLVNLSKVTSTGNPGGSKVTSTGNPGSRSLQAELKADKNRGSSGARAADARETDPAVDDEIKATAGGSIEKETKDKKPERSTPDFIVELTDRIIRKVGNEDPRFRFDESMVDTLRPCVLTTIDLMDVGQWKQADVLRAVGHYFDNRKPRGLSVVLHDWAVDDYTDHPVGSYYAAKYAARRRAYDERMAARHAAEREKEAGEHDPEAANRFDEMARSMGTKMRVSTPR